ncbi:ABC transporter ATP-binding protein [Serinibacter salmoneus]|uniref:ATP-binding cassette subfamily B protein n=1 Tax=Serinibacter salmoneus TaxID=556530 RepID=A0A2A9CXW4_9MICO|nr:ABC transporter ATP-binding protein [Serinibacter salmoneus]PFG19278.1 ATP-binding cassette subfamily B protein [Serinibacter salmoneus]
MSTALPSGPRPEEQPGRDTERAAGARASLQLLGSLLRPVRGRAILLAITVAGAQLALASGPTLVSYGIDSGIPALIDGSPAPALAAVLGYLGIAVVGGVLAAETVRMAARVSQAMLLDLRTRLFRHTQRLDLEFHEGYTSGRIISRQTSDTEALRELLDGGVTTLAASGLSMVFTATYLLLLDWVSGLVLLIAIIPGAILTRWFQLRSRVQYTKQRNASARVIVRFVEAMTGIRALQAFRRERVESARYDGVARDFQRSTAESIRLFGLLDSGLILIGNVTVAAVLLVGGLRVLAGDIEVGVLAAAVLYAKRFFAPLAQIGTFYNSFQSAIAALDKLATLLLEEPTVPEPERPRPLAHPRGEVRFDGVEFGYGRGASVLPDLHLEIPAGQNLAMVGTTGAGKSTIAKLVTRFYDARSGSVSIDGVDVRDLATPDLRRAVVMVTQEAYLFSGSVAANIAIGNPTATREEVIAAARAVGVHEVIEQFPQGYDTPVDTRGVRLSAGQRQLVSFARAFLANPAVLVLDEATSSLDIPGERIVQQGLRTLLAGRTSIVIAHRLSTVMNADRVLVLEHGQIIEDGTPEELAAGTGHFAALYAGWQATLG